MLKKQFRTLNEKDYNQMEELKRQESTENYFT